MGWIYLLLAGFFEVVFATSLKLSEGFTKLLPSIVFIISSGMSFWFLTKALQTISLGTAYAVWTGVGAFGIAIVGIIFFEDPSSFWRLFFLFMLIASVIGLKTVSTN